MYNGTSFRLGVIEGFVCMLKIVQIIFIFFINVQLVGQSVTAGESGGDMLRRVGECRKKVMGLYRLLGNKADVIKGFAKRCNEHWEVAPRSEIGLYLGDIQDHIVTMTGNLSHYER